MVTTNCFIVEDLLPLYNEGLLSDETEDWVKEHLNNCLHCKALEQVTTDKIMEEVISSPINYEKMISKITFKLSLYQMAFIGLSFFLALKTTLLNDSFGFILSYAVLGFVTYLFYKNFKIVSGIAFLPVFFWSIGTTASLNELISSILGSILIAGIHLAFAVIGALVGLLLLKIRESGEIK